MIRVATKFRDKNNKVIFSDNIMINSRGHKFTIDWYAGEWSVVDSEGFIPFSLEDLLDDDSVEIVGIHGYHNT